MKTTLLFLIVLISAGCSERNILKDAEKYLVDHLGDPKSYQRIEWGISDTTYENDVKMKEISERISDLEEKIKFENYDPDKVIFLHDDDTTTIYDTIVADNLKQQQHKHPKRYTIYDTIVADNYNRYTISFKDVRGEHDSLKIAYDNLKQNNQSILLLHPFIRFRAKIGDYKMPLTFKCNLEYDFKPEQFRVIDLKFAGIENSLRN